MSGNLPDDPSKKNPFGDIMETLNGFFHERPGRGLLESIDEFFASPNSFGGFPVQLEENSREYIVTAKLPGVKKDQISIDVYQQYLKLTVEDHETYNEENERKHTIQRRQSSRKSTRTIPLASPVDERRVKASHQDGLLTLKLPKIKGKRIEID